MFLVEKNKIENQNRVTLCAIYKCVSYLLLIHSKVYILYVYITYIDYLINNLCRHLIVKTIVETITKVQ